MRICDWSSDVCSSDLVLDVKFRNNGPTSVQIQTEWTSSSITARLVGIKRYEVTSRQRPRSRPTSPRTITIPYGSACDRQSVTEGKCVAVRVVSGRLRCIKINTTMNTTRQNTMY